MSDAFGAVSIAMIGIGCFQIYEPLGLLVPGVIIFAMAALAAKNSAPKTLNKKVEK